MTDFFGMIQRLFRRRRVWLALGGCAVAAAAALVFTLHPWARKTTAPAVRRSYTSIAARGVRAVVISTSGAAADFPSKSGLSETQLRQEIAQRMKQIAGWGFNAVFVEAVTPEGAVYPSEAFGWNASLKGKSGQTPGWDPLGAMIQEAHRNGLKLYACVSPLAQNGKSVQALPAGSLAAAHTDWFSAQKDGALSLDPGVPGVRSAAAEAVASLVTRERPDGVVLDGDVYPAGGLSDERVLRQYGAGQKASVFRRRSADALVKAVFLAVRKADASVPFGVETSGVWANANGRAGGSQTRAAETALFSHSADVLSWMRVGWVDFVLPRTFGSLTDKQQPFEAAAGWWARQAAQTSTGFYGGVSADSVGGSQTGWQSADQPIRQLRALQKLSGCGGAAVFGLGTLEKNPDGLTDALAAYFAGKLDASFGAALEITSPADGMLTKATQITVRGKSDANFPLTLNGKAVAREKGGRFSVQVTLQPGSNTLTLENKGLKKSLRVLRSVPILSSVQPTRTVSEFGGTGVTLIAAARGGAAVTASVGGKEVTLSQLPSVPAGVTMPALPAGFACFSGTYTMPDSAKDRDLGRLQVTASWNGLSASMTGGEFHVKAFAPLKAGQKWIALLKVKAGEANNLYIETYRFNDDLYRPDTDPQLPGAWDTIEQNADTTPKVYAYGDSRYYKLSNGQLIYTDNVDLQAQAMPALNQATSIRAGSAGGGRYTRFLLQFSSRVTYTAGTDVVYPNAAANAAGRRDYSISSFNATSFTITFYHTSGMPLPNGFTSSVISRVVCSKPSTTTLRYTFYFRHPGAYYGTYLSYNGTQMVMDFKNPWDGNLKTLRIALDPGHCVEFPGAVGLNVNEKDINLRIVLALRQKLIEAGVPAGNIFVTRTTDSYPYSPLAVNLAMRNVSMVNFRPDVSLCVHANAQDGTQTGAESYYFQPFSQPFAAALQKGLVSAYRTAVTADHYPAYPGMGLDRGVKFTSYSGNSGDKPKAYYSCRQFETPSSLVECGFVDNAAECRFLNSAVGANRLAEGLRSGIFLFMDAQKALR